MSAPIRPCLSALCLVAVAAPATAQIAPAELWARWQAGDGSIAAVGGTASEAGAGLEVTDARLRLGTSDDAPVVVADRLILSPEGGATAVEMPQSWSVEAGELIVALSAPDAVLTASGEIDDPVYSFAAASLDAVTDALPTSDGPVPATLALGAVEARYADDGGFLAAGTLEALVGPEEGGTRVEVSLEDAEVTLDGPVETLAETMAESGLPAAPFEIALSAGAGRQYIETVDPEGQPLQITLETETAEARLASDGSRSSVEQSFSGAQVSATGPGVPLPDASLGIGAGTLRFDGPVTPGEEPQPFSFDAALDGVGVSEQVWQLIDPAGELPRDAATLRLAVSGETVLPPPGPDGAVRPPYPERLALETARLTALGAEVTGSGSVLFTQPPSAERQFGAPVGLATLTFTGVMGLIDRIEALGSLPQGPLMGARMGLAFMTRAGQGEDELVTQIEIGSDGMIVMNGQQIFQLP